MMMALVLALAFALAASLAIEAATASRPISLRPGPLAVRLAAYALLVLFWFQFSWRPWLAGTSCVLTVAILSGVSLLKHRIIGEPLVFSDFALLRQVPRHPELYYVPPLSDPRMALPLLAGFSIVAFWYVLEPTVLPSEPMPALAAIAGLPLLLAGLWAAAMSPPARAWLRARRPLPRLDGDVTRFGLPATLLFYALRWADERRMAPAPAPAPAHATPTPALSLRPAPAHDPAGSEVVVVVQLESFVDPERLGGAPLPLMARIRTEAAQYGRLAVPAHGAYTMRTEHAVLTGRDAGSLGFALFDPYLAAGGREPTSLARRAAETGFETVFVHPFHPGFFGRTRVMRELGFRRLVMEPDFGGAARVGPYIGDLATCERVLTEVAGRTSPTFVFCVTMENHGPWRAGRLAGIDDPLAQYLHHAANTGRAVERLLDGLVGTNAILCIFGDHAPSLPTCRPGFGEGRTDYAVFRFGRAGGTPQRVDLAAHDLGCLLRGALRTESEPAGGPSVTVPRS